MNTNGHEFFHFHSCEFASIRGSSPLRNKVDIKLIFRIDDFFQLTVFNNTFSTTKSGMHPRGAFVPNWSSQRSGGASNILFVKFRWEERGQSRFFYQSSHYDVLITGM